MKCLSRQDIEAIATRVVTAYYKLPELQGQQIHRIDPELLLTKVLGLNIEYYHLSRDNSILGATSASEMGIEVFDNDDNEAIYFLDGKTVLVEKDLKDDTTQQGRCNFTIAHEGKMCIRDRLSSMRRCRLSRRCRNRLERARGTSSGCRMAIRRRSTLGSSRIRRQAYRSA